MSQIAVQALQGLIDRRSLERPQMVALMREMMRGELAPALVGALLAALRCKGETVTEIAAAAEVMREFAIKVEVADPSHFVDIVGTGGDGAHTFNISTASMFVASAAGARVAKHGNRSVSSRSGSADVLEALGADIQLGPAEVAACLQQCGAGFMFAPLHHPAMKAVIGVRRELGVRTVFNILGPLTNPASAPNILLGVFSEALVPVMLEVLQRLGAQRALVVWGRDGMDEITMGAATCIGELNNGATRIYDIHPRDFGLELAASHQLRVADAQESKQMLLQALSGAPGAARDVVGLNAGAALYAAGVVDSIADGRLRALAAIDSGAARQQVDRFVALSQALGAKA